MTDDIYTQPDRRFALDKDNAKFLGVCSGIARSLNVEALWVRVALVASVLAGFGLPLLLYFLVAFIAD